MLEADWSSVIHTSERSEAAMSVNPYEAPSMSNLPQSNEGSDARFVSAHGRALLTMVCLGLFAAVALLSLGVKGVILLRLTQLNQGFRPSGASLFAVVEGLLMIVQACMYLACVICFLLWLYRASRNIQALGAEKVEHSPRGAIGWWFVPIANLFKPYIVLKEIYQASKSSQDQPRRWKLKPVPAVFGWWWGCWLLGQMGSRAVTRLGGNVETPGGLVALAWGEIGATMLMLAAAILAIFVVQAIDQRQRAGYEVWAAE
jgi:hypothetical protein